MNHGLVEATPARTISITDRKGPATMADKTTAQTTIDAVLRRYGLNEAAPKPKKQRANGFPGAPRIDRKAVALSRGRTAFRAAPQRPLRIPGRG
ncbi:hypothetical protein [Nocardia iowensis]|uniref:Uncharacterized protein n=1 Tax=Nocardia iowensis TaxID=204891 RepID=A0ABX8RWV2_NOCIO|nr:hypothetical protein [Nocardia iowensis]QXN92880.1 hypothetical protein KV110_07120 [Nocardia iowensis]